MHHDKRTAKRPGYAARGIALLAVAVALATTAGTVWAGTGPDVDPVPAPSASIKPVVAKPGFYETYRGHHIMGWGANAKACAYIDGVPLVLYPSGDGQYTSNLAAFELKSSVRAITRASVKTLGKLPPAAPSDAPAHCPALVVRKPAPAPAKPAPAPAKSTPAPAKPAPAPEK